MNEWMRQQAHLHGVQRGPEVALVGGVMRVLHQLLLDRTTFQNKSLTEETWVNFLLRLRRESVQLQKWKGG